MSTGYTYAVKDGKVTELKDFAMQCARAFGACITMRDDPIDAEIPNAFEPSDFHAKSLAAAQARLADLRTMSDREIARAVDADYEKAVEYWRERMAKRKAERERYEAMIAKVEAWTPPTDEHVGLKNFMLEQLRDSLDFDCGTSSFDKMPVRQTEAAWHAAQVAGAERRIARDAEEHQKEVDRVKGRTEWVAALRRSLEGAS